METPASLSSPDSLPGPSGSNESTIYTHQVQLLATSIRLATDALDQVIAPLSQLVEQLQQLKDNLEVVDEARRQELDDLISATDAVKKATAGLLVIQQQQNAEARQQAAASGA